MQYVWQHRLWIPGTMTDVDGNAVSVIDPGLLNTNAGPDFFNAKVRIGSRMWVGNIEIHVRASDWHRHGHDSDKAYDSVVLHVVQNSDARIKRTNGEVIPQLVMQCAQDFHSRYNAMVNNPMVELSCAQYIPSVEPIHLRSWITALAHERLLAKCDRIHALYKRLNGDWQAVVFVTLARALGFGLNSEPFERMALSVPPAVLMKHRDNPLALEAVLLGQSGLLDEGQQVDASSAEYFERLRGEYSFMCAKFGLKAPESLGWKMARMRPQNFPHRRLAALAAIVAGGFAPASKIFYVKDIESARELFNVVLKGFWAGHVNFGPGIDGGEARAFSTDSQNILIINVVAPLLAAYGELYGHEESRERAVAMLESLPAERNNITRLFRDAGIDCPDAFTSQALIQLRREYCEPRKCLYCRLGHRFLSRLRQP